jgi:amino acid adenylation domain-containing protein
MARHLQRLGAAQESLVGVCLTRSVEAVIALLGILKSGGTYLPIDAEYPSDRIAYTLHDARASILVTEQRLLPLLHSISGFSELKQSRDEDTALPWPALVCLETDRKAIATERTDNPRSGVNAENLAYVIYTSGSTGRPKGVMITHANVCHYVQAMREALSIAQADRYLHTASFAFSSSVRQCAVPLSRGACVVVASTDQIQDPQSLFDLVRSRHVSIIDIVPSYWRSCIQVLQGLKPARRSALLDNELRLIVSASEPLPTGLLREWGSSIGHGARLINMFGQTETTGIVTVHEISAFAADASQVVPIGRPIANTQAYVLDASRQLAPVGVSGELYIGGEGVGRGYLNQPEMTAERFVADPFRTKHGNRLYRTGDIARYRTDGNIEIFGRDDEQVKVRGFRIEPGEIEAVLREHPGVKESVVAGQVDSLNLNSCDSANDAVPTKGDSQRLVAFVVPTECAQSSSRSSGQSRHLQSPELSIELREFLRRRLPEYMIPSVIVALGELPRTPSGKVDRKALATHFEFGSGALDPMSRQRGAGTSAAPRTVTERRLAKIWKQVLRVDRVGIDDNFFDLGGDSILSIQVITRSNQAGLNLSLKQIFQYQTIAGLARIADAGHNATSESATANGRSGFVTTAGDIDPVILVSVESLRAYGQEALERAGLATRGAEIVTDVQLEANLRGQVTHNMLSIPRYARRIASGAINPQPNIRVERETAISALIDGDNAPGQWVAVVAMETAIRKAQESGVGIVSARRSNHFGAAGHYVWQAAREALIGICTTNGPLILAPIGGLVPTFGNNPLAVGIPAARHHPVLLDIAMSVAPRGKIGLRVAQGKPLPPGWILDRFGRPSTNLADLAAGLGVPIAGHKGYGLALVMEALAGALSGAGFCLDHRREPERKRAKPPDFGHFFLVFDPSILMPPAEFTSRVDRMIEQAKTGERVANTEEIFIPGEAELRARERNLRNGIPLRHSALAVLRTYAREAGLNTELETAEPINNAD